MSLQRQDKEERVRSLHGVFAEAETVIVAHYSGLDVAALTDLRADLSESGSFFRVTKNSFALRALKGLPCEDSLSPLFKGPTAIAWGSDATALPKALISFAEEHESMRILGGVMDGAALAPEAIEALAKLPSLDALRAKIVGILQAPAAKLAAQMNAPASHLARLFGAYAASAGKSE